MNWYYVLNGERHGPIDEAVLRTLVNQGQVGPDDLVWNQTLGDEWKKCADVFKKNESLPVAGPTVAGNGGSTPNGELTADARAALSGNWGVAVGTAVLYGVIVFAISIVSSLLPIPFLGNLIQLFLLPPLLVGLSFFFLSLSRKQGGSAGDLFSGFQKYWTSIGAYFFMNLFLMLWMLPGFVLMIGGMVLPALSQNAPSGGEALSAVGGVVAAIGGIYLFVAAIIVSLRYSQIFFAVADDEPITALSALRRSIELMKGRKWKYFCLSCRFIGWSLLAMLTMGIGFLWVTPYLYTAYARFYDDLK